MKKLRRVIALLLSVMMLMSTQGMTVLAKTQYDNTAEGDVLTETDSADEEDDSTGKNWDATAEGELAEENETERISETLPIEPVTSREQTSEVERINETLSVEPASTDDLTSAAERINETLPVEPLASSTAGTSAAERINETMPIEPLGTKTNPYASYAAIYWNPGAETLAELLADPSDTAASADKASPSDAEIATASNASQEGDDRAHGLSPKYAVKSLETAVQRAARLADANGVSRSDIVIYAMNPMEISDKQLVILNGGGVNIVSWPERDYDNDTIFYINGGQLSLVNTTLASGRGTDPDETELVRIDAGALQLGSGVETDGRIVMDYRSEKEKTEWDTATASDAKSTKSASGWVESDGFDISRYIFSTDADDWEVLEDTSEESTRRMPIIELMEGFKSVQNTYTLEIRNEDDLNEVTLARTLYADTEDAASFGACFRLAEPADELESEWSLSYYSEAAEDTAALVDDTAALASEDAEDVTEDALSSEDTVKVLSAVRTGSGTVGAGIFLSGSGSNENDGRTPNTPVRTFARAMERLREEIEAKSAKESSLPEEGRRGFTPHIYICGTTVEISSDQEWRMNYDSELFTVTNAAFNADTVKADHPDWSDDYIRDYVKPQVRRYTDFKDAMIAVGPSATLDLDDIIIDGAAEYVSDGNPVISAGGTASTARATVNMRGTSQLRSNAGGGVKLGAYSELSLYDTARIEDIEGNAVELAGIGASFNMLMNSRILSEKRRDGAVLKDRCAVYAGDDTNVQLRDAASISVGDAETAARLRGALYLDGGVSVTGQIRLENPDNPIRLCTVPASGNQYHLSLAESFLGKNAVIPEGTSVTDAAQYLSEFVKAEDGIKEHENWILKSASPNIVLEEANWIYLSGEGDDTKNGLSPETAVRTFHRARQLLSTSYFKEGANILICGKVPIAAWTDRDGSAGDDTDWSFGEGGTLTNSVSGETWTPLVKRDKAYSGGALIEHGLSGKTLVFKNIIIDGNGADVRAAAADGSSAPLLDIKDSGAEVLLADGAIFRNNHVKSAADGAASGIEVNAGSLTLAGGQITGMRMILDAPDAGKSVTGAAVAVSSGASFNMKSGMIDENSVEVSGAVSGEVKGGAVLIANGGSFNLSGGSIRSNMGGQGSAVCFIGQAQTTGGGVTLAGGSITGNTVHTTVASAASPRGSFAPIYVDGYNFRLDGACEASDAIYLNSSAKPLTVGGAIPSGRIYKVWLNEGSGTGQYKKGSIAVIPDGTAVTDAASCFDGIRLYSDQYVLDSGRGDTAITSNAAVAQKQCLVLMRRIFVSGTDGDDTRNGLTPDSPVKTFEKAQALGEMGDGTKDAYVIYVCGQIMPEETDVTWSTPSPSYVCRYTGFEVYRSNGTASGGAAKAYYGNLIRAAKDGFTLSGISVYGRRAVDGAEHNGEALVYVPGGVSVFVGIDEAAGQTAASAVFGRNNNTGTYEDPVNSDSKTLSGRGGAFYVETRGQLCLAGGVSISDMEAVQGAAVYVAADASNNADNGILKLYGSVSLTGAGDVYLGGTGTDEARATAAVVDIDATWAPADGEQIKLVLQNHYIGRPLVRFESGMTPGTTERSYFKLDEFIQSSYGLGYTDTAPANSAMLFSAARLARSATSMTLELTGKTAVYIDGKNGSDLNDGNTPDTAFKTLQKVYSHIRERQEAGTVSADNDTLVYVVGTISIEDTVVLENTTVQKDGSTSRVSKYSYSDGVTEVTDQISGYICFKRYAQPSGYTDSDATYDGYAKETLKNSLFLVEGEGGLSLCGVELDGHSEPQESANPLYAANGVEAQAPIIQVVNEGSLNLGSVSTTENPTPKMTVLANNRNILNKDGGSAYRIGDLNGKAVYEGVSAGVEASGSSVVYFDWVEFRNLSLGEDVVGGTDLYHNSTGENVSYVQGHTVFGGTVFLEGLGTTATSRYLQTLNDSITTGNLSEIHLLFRDPYAGRAVVKYLDAEATVEQFATYVLDKRVLTSFSIIKNASDPLILELAEKLPVYIDGVNGDDMAVGSDPAHPVKTLKRAYELLNTYYTDKIFVVNNPISVAGTTEISGNTYTGTDGTVSLGDGVKVTIARYIQPDFARNNTMTGTELAASGYNVGDYTGSLLVVGGGTITLGKDLILDGRASAWASDSHMKEITVTRDTSSLFPLVQVLSAFLTLQDGCELRNNNNTYDGTGTIGKHGGAIYNEGQVTVNSAVFTDLKAKKGDGIYNPVIAGTSGITQLGGGDPGLAGHSIYLGAENRGTESEPNWLNSELHITGKLNDDVTLTLDMDHAEAGRDVVKFTTADAYAPADGADAEYLRFALGTTVPQELFLVQVEDDPTVLELQDWKVLKTEVPTDIYLVARQKSGETTTELKSVQTGTEELLSSPNYQVKNKGAYDVKVILTGLDSLNAEAGITWGEMQLKATASDAVGYSDIYLAVRGTDVDSADGFVFAESALLNGMQNDLELGTLKAGSSGNFEFSVGTGSGFIETYLDDSFPLTGKTADEVQDYMDGTGALGLNARAKYLLRYRVELVPPRR